MLPLIHTQLDAFTQENKQVRLYVGCKRGSFSVAQISGLRLELVLQKGVLFHVCSETAEGQTKVQHLFL